MSTVKYDTFRWARNYYHDGFNVIPVKPGTKRPEDFWKKYQKVRVTLEEITHWYKTMAALNFGVGIVTGRISDVTVVDSEKEAIDLAREFWREHPTPLISKTGGGGGIHLFYRYAPYGNRVKIDGEPVDIRGDGGFLVVPPTQHPSGTRYEWADCPVQNVPQFDPEWFPEPPAPDAYVPIDGSEDTERARNYISKITAISGQAGHDTTFRAVCKLRDRGIRQDLALALMLDWNQTNASPPWTVKELTHKVQDAYKQAMDLMAARDGCRVGNCDLGGRMWE